MQAEEEAAVAKEKAEEEARARAKEEAELREIFRLADTDRSGYIDETELLGLGKAVNPNFTSQAANNNILVIILCYYD